MGIINIIIFDDDDLTQAMADSYLRDITFPISVHRYNNFSENLIPNDSNLNIIFVNINTSNISLLQTIQKLSSEKKNKFIIISADKSTDLHVKALRTGAKDFLLKPLVKTEFTSIIQKICDNEINKDGNIMSNIYTVISPEQGMGKTLFIVNLAKEIADIKKDKVLIVDFNNNVNDISIMLDINSKYNTSFILNNINNQNAQDLLSNIQQYGKSSLYIMANGLFTTSLSVELQNFQLFLQEAKKQYKYIFIDMDPQLEDINSYILQNSNFIYCLLDTKTTLAEKAKNYLLNKKLFSRTRFIINRFRERNIDKVQEIETLMEKQVFCKIPQVVMSASMSMQSGKTLKELNPDMDIVKVYMDMAKSIVNKE